MNAIIKHFLREIDDFSRILLAHADLFERILRRHVLRQNTEGRRERAANKKQRDGEKEQQTKNSEAERREANKKQWDGRKSRPAHNDIVADMTQNHTECAGE